jgi:hypothetical protein
MSQMNFATIFASAEARCKRTKSDTLITQNIQLAVTKLSNKYNFPRLQKTDTVETTASSATTSIPSDLKEIYDERSVVLYRDQVLDVDDEDEDGDVTEEVISQIQGIQLNIVTAGEFFARYPKPEDDSKAQPTEVAVFSQDLLWYPVPDAAYTPEDTDELVPYNYKIQLRYYRFHPDFDADSGNTEHHLGEEADRAIIAETVAMTYQDFQEYEDSTYWYGIAAAHMADVISNEISGIAVAMSNRLYVNAGLVSTHDRTDYGRPK